MATNLTSKGQVTVPKAVRDYLGLKPRAAVTFERLPELDALDNVSLVRIAPTRGLPHFEQPEAVKAALDRFWAGLPR